MENTGRLFLNIDYMMSGVGYNSLGEKEKYRYLLTEKDIVLILDKVVCCVPFMSVAGAPNGESAGV